MFANYLKITFRNLLRHRGHAFINILGLSIGIAAAILIFLYARNELSYDAFHENGDKTYIVYKERNTATGTQILYDTWIPLANELKQDYPEVVSASRAFTRNRWVISGDNKFQDRVTYADPAFLEIFTFPLADGGSESVLKERSAVILSQEIAEKYFGNENPIGKTISINYRNEYTVRGILAPVPENSTIEVDLLVNVESLIDPDDEDAQQNWNSAFLETYIQLNTAESAAALQAKLPGLVEKTWGTDGPNGSKNHQLKLLPITGFYNAQTSANRYAYILLGIAAMILLIASINFMNLATSRSLDRAREIGMRKVLGAQRMQLIWQFLGESLMLSMLALIIGVGLAKLLLPAFNTLYELTLTFDIGANLPVIGTLLLLGLSVGLISGSYPALVLSGFKPIDTLKNASGMAKEKFGGKWRHRLLSTANVRKTLVVVQFGLSIILILGTIIVWQQIEHMKSQDLNFRQDNIVAIPVNVGDFSDREAAAVHLQALKDELLQTAGIRGVASSSGVPGEYPNMNTFAWPEDWQREEPLRIRVAVADENFFEVFGMEILEGRNFSTEFSTDADEAIILNEAAVEAMGWQTAIGKTVRRGNRPFTVIGVVKDFHFESLQNEIIPVIHHYRPTESRAHNYMSVAVAGKNLSGVLSLLQDKWVSLDPQRSFDYFFVNERFAEQYRAEERMGTVSGFFSLIAISIACLGLFALASFTVARKTREIGIRKTLGATVPGIVRLIATSFLKLVVVALAVAGPLAYFLMDRWLADYPYRIAIGWEVFAATIAVTLLITALAIGYQTIRAALSNPVDALRYE